MRFNNLAGRMLRIFLICVLTLTATGTFLTSTVFAAVPTMTAITADTNTDGTIDQITITFSESSDVIDGNAANGLASIALTDGCTIPNGDYAVSGTTSLVLNNLTGCTPGDTGITPSVTYTSVASCATENAICDTALANQMANSTTTVAADGAAPTNSIVVADLSASAAPGAGSGLSNLANTAITRNETSKLQILIKASACADIDAATADLSTFGTTAIPVGNLSSTLTLAASDYVCYRLVDNAGNDTGWTNSTDGQIPSGPLVGNLSASARIGVAYIGSAEPTGSYSIWVNGSVADSGVAHTNGSDTSQTVTGGLTAADTMGYSYTEPTNGNESPATADGVIPAGPTAGNLSASALTGNATIGAAEPTGNYTILVNGGVVASAIAHTTATPTVQAVGVLTTADAMTYTFINTDGNESPVTADGAIPASPTAGNLSASARTGDATIAAAESTGSYTIWVNGGVTDVVPHTTATPTVQSVTGGLVVADAMSYSYVEGTNGNESALTADGQIPATPTGLDLNVASDSGTSQTDDYTNDTTPQIDGSATGTDTVTLYSTVGVNPIGSAPAIAGVFNITTNALTNSNLGIVHAITATDTNANGNESAASTGLNVTIDTSAAAPGAPDMHAASDTGGSDSDDITSNTTAAFAIGGLEYGATAYLISNVNGAQGNAVENPLGGGTAHVIAAGLTGSIAGTAHNISATQTDIAGNTSAASGNLAAVIDTGVAQPAAPDMQAASDLGISNTDDYTSNDTPIFTGVAGETGSWLRLYTSFPSHTQKGGRIDSGLMTSSALQSTAQTGDIHTMTIEEEDVAGNVSVPSTGLVVTIDVTGPVLAETTPVTTPTNNQTPNLTFSTNEDGGISWAGGCDSVTTAATLAGSPETITLDSDGAGGNLAEATYNCTLTVTDDAGALTGLVLSAFTIDITPPTGTASVGTATLFEGDLAQEVTITYNEPMDPVSTPTINFAGTAGGFTSQANGTWASATTWTETFDIADANEEVVGATVDSSGATDAAGNAEGAPTNTTFNVDTLAPTLTPVTIASDNVDPTKGTTGDNVTLTMTPSETINQPVVAYTSGAAAITNATTYGGAWTASYLVDIADTSGVVGYTIDFTDTAGNAGTQVTTTTDASSVTVDSAGPVVLTYSPADDATNAAILANLVLTFDENVVVGTGNVVIYHTSDDSIFETIDITGGLVTFNGTTGVTINPTASFVNSTAYYIQIAATAIEDTIGNPYLGIADKTTWNFTTVAVPPPPVSSGGSGGGGNAGGRVVPAETTPTEPTTIDPAADLTTLVDFWDIDGHWGETYIDDVNEAGYVEGYEDSSFKPNIYITRAEASKLIASWLDDSLTDADCDASLFSDVACSEWYGKYVTYLYLQDIIEGYGNGEFNPGANVSRSEALKMLLFTKNLHNRDVAGVSNPFPDNNEGAWYYNLVLIGYDLGIVQGYEDGTFRPTNAITRAEFTKIFDKILLDI